jgi:hypothetical protein
MPERLLFSTGIWMFSTRPTIRRHFGQERKFSRGPTFASQLYGRIREREVLAGRETHFPSVLDAFAS